MEKQKLIQKINLIDPIKYSNGNGVDSFHLGHILIHFIENEYGAKSYQELNILLNDSLTLEGSVTLKSLMSGGGILPYESIYAEYKNTFTEVLIIKEFPTMIELIYNQLQELNSKKIKQLHSHIDHLLNQIVLEDPILNQKIDIPKTSEFIKNRIKREIALFSKTAHEINEFNIYSNEIFESVYSSLIVYYKENAGKLKSIHI